MRGDTAGQSGEIREEWLSPLSASDLQENGEFAADGPAAPRWSSPFHHCDETNIRTTNGANIEALKPQPWFTPGQLREIWLKRVSLLTYIYSKMVYTGDPVKFAKDS